MTQKERALNKANQVKGFQKLKLRDEVNSSWTMEEILSELFRFPTSTRHVKGNRAQKTGALRSITDSYRVVSFYHPDVKIHEVIDRIRTIDFRNGSGNTVVLNPSFCWVVRKCVFSQSIRHDTGGSRTKTEFGGLSLGEATRLFIENDI